MTYAVDGKQYVAVISGNSLDHLRTARSSEPALRAETQRDRQPEARACYGLASASARIRRSTTLSVAAPRCR